MRHATGSNNVLQSYLSRLRDLKCFQITTNSLFAPTHTSIQTTVEISTAIAAQRSSFSQLAAALQGSYKH